MIENLYAYTSLLFVITLFIIIRQVRLINRETVKSAIKNPLWPRTPMSFFLNVYRLYYDLKGFDIVFILNIGCFVVATISLIYNFIEAIISNLS